MIAKYVFMFFFEKTKNNFKIPEDGKDINQHCAYKCNCFSQLKHTDINDQCSHHTETSQLTGCYMIGHWSLKG